MNEVFTFVDASHLFVKASLWEERDEALKQKHEKLNNEVLPKTAHDKQARIGCKGKNKYWYGYKKHLSMDMQSGIHLLMSEMFKGLNTSALAKELFTQTKATVLPLQGKLQLVKDVT
jgi:hypothetical protein